MKFALISLVSLTLVGCSGEIDLPTAPGPPVPTAVPAPAPTPRPVAFLAGMVLGIGGGCIVGATVEVVRGQGVGQSITQHARCSWWDWEDGFVFSDLTPDVPMTLRASAPGFASTEATFLPSLQRDGRGRYQAILELSRLDDGD